MFLQAKTIGYCCFGLISAALALHPLAIYAQTANQLSPGIAPPATPPSLPAPPPPPAPMPPPPMPSDAPPNLPRFYPTEAWLPIISSKNRITAIGPYTLPLAITLPPYLKPYRTALVEHWTLHSTTVDVPMFNVQFFFPANEEQGVRQFGGQFSTVFDPAENLDWTSNYLSSLASPGAKPEMSDLQKDLTPAPPQSSLSTAISFLPTPYSWTDVGVGFTKDKFVSVVWMGFALDKKKYKTANIMRPYYAHDSPIKSSSRFVALTVDFHNSHAPALRTSSASPAQTVPAP